MCYVVQDFQTSLQLTLTIWKSCIVHIRKITAFLVQTKTKAFKDEQGGCSVI